MSEKIDRFRELSLPKFLADERSPALVKVIDWLEQGVDDAFSLSDIARVGLEDHVSSLSDALWIATVLSSGPIQVIDARLLLCDDQGDEFVVKSFIADNGKEMVRHPVTGKDLPDWQQNTILQFVVSGGSVENLTSKDDLLNVSEYTDNSLSDPKPF